MLTKYERESAAWKKIEEHLLTRLANLREKNDGFLSLDETTRLRGRILEVKDLLALGREPIVTDDE